MGDVVEQVRQVASRVTSGYGLEIFDVQFRREASGMVLRVRIDRPGPAASAEESVSVEDCANVSRDRTDLLHHVRGSHKTAETEPKRPINEKSGHLPTRSYIQGPNTEL